MMTVICWVAVLASAMGVTSAASASESNAGLTEKRGPPIIPFHKEGFHMFKKFLLVSLLFGSPFIIGCASLPSPEEPKAKLVKVPKLNIRWSCGDCSINEKVIPLLEQTYFEEANKNNQSISTDDVADVVIVDFRQRNPSMRVMFGIMAGKDRLGVKVNYKGKEFAAEDYSANSRQGMNALCESVAKIAYKKIVDSTKE